MFEHEGSKVGYWPTADIQQKSAEVPMGPSSYMMQEDKQIAPQMTSLQLLRSACDARSFKGATEQLKSSYRHGT